MMKTLIVLNGPMGVGKTTVGKELCRRLTPSIFLDGDWCWDLHPFSVTDATKALVMDNIRALLRRDLDCPEVDYVVFVWVLQQEETAAALLDGLDEKARILRITLVPAMNPSPGGYRRILPPVCAPRTAWNGALPISGSTPDRAPCTSPPTDAPPRSSPMKLPVWSGIVQNPEFCRANRQLPCKTDVFILQAAVSTV